MNKALILQYKKEFDHWLSGGEVLCTDPKNGNETWRPVDETGDDFTYTGKVLPKFKIKTVRDTYFDALLKAHTELQSKYYKLLAHGVSTNNEKLKTTKDFTKSYI